MDSPPPPQRGHSAVPKKVLEKNLSNKRNDFQRGACYVGASPGGARRVPLGRGDFLVDAVLSLRTSGSFASRGHEADPQGREGGEAACGPAKPTLHRVLWERQRALNQVSCL